MNAVVSLAHQFVVVRSAVAWHGRVSRDPYARLHLAEGRRDPYAIYDEVRRRGELVPSPLVGFQTATHRLCRQVLRDRRFGVQVEGALNRGDGRMSLLELDPPDHTRLRRLVAPAFTPHAIAGYRTRIETVVDGLLDAQPGDGPWDLVAGLASPLPIAVITDLLGVPDANSAAFARYGATIGSALAGPQSVVSRGPADRGRPPAQAGVVAGVRPPPPRTRRRHRQPTAGYKRVISSRRKSWPRCACCCCWPASRPPSTSSATRCSPSSTGRTSGGPWSRIPRWRPPPWRRPCAGTRRCSAPFELRRPTWSWPERWCREER